MSGELGAVTGVEVSGESADGGGLLGGGDVVLEVEVGANEVEELLSAHVGKRVGLGGVNLPRNVALKLIDELLSDGVLFSRGENGESASSYELEHNL